LLCLQMGFSKSARPQKNYRIGFLPRLSKKFQLFMFKQSWDNLGQNKLQKDRITQIAYNVHVQEDFFCF
jgi:hypothetical protein